MGTAATASHYGDDGIGHAPTEGPPPLQKPNPVPGCPEGTAATPIVSVLLSSSLSSGVLQCRTTPPSSWSGPCCTGMWATSSPCRGKRGCLGRGSSWEVTKKIPLAAEPQSSRKKVEITGCNETDFGLQWEYFDARVQVGPGSGITCRRSRNVFPIQVQHPRHEGRRPSAAVSFLPATLCPPGTEPHPALLVRRDFGGPDRWGMLSCPDLLELPAAPSPGEQHRQARGGERGAEHAWLHMSAVFPALQNASGTKAFVFSPPFPFLRSSPFSSRCFFFSFPRLVLRQ